MEIDFFRRQYLFGPRAPTRFEWPTRGVAQHVFAAHPDLSVCARSDEDRQLLCIGELFDADHPELTNEDVANRLFERFSNFAALEAATATLGGRWSLIARDKSGIRIYPDATGSVPIHYAEIDGHLWVSSLPSIIAMECGLELDDALIAEFRRTPAGDWWPGALTSYPEVRHSWPNFYLDVEHKRPSRFWPLESVAPVDVESAARTMARMLDGLLRAAARRFQLYLALTGGYDSRTLLAVAKPLHREIQTYTMAYPGVPSFDIDTCHKLTRRFSIPYSVERCDEPPEDFLAGFDGLASHMVTGLGRLNAYSYRRFAPPDAFFVEGTASEIVRSYFLSVRNKERIVQASALASVCGFESKRAEEAIDEWLSQIPTTLGFDPVDLFYWEQRVGNWNATDYQTQECVRRVFSPFNCRELLVTGLGAPVPSRRDRCRLYRRICELTLPETLDYRFNFTARVGVRRLVGRVARVFRAFARHGR